MSKGKKQQQSSAPKAPRAAAPVLAAVPDEGGELIQVAVIDRELLRLGKIIGWMLIIAGVILALGLAWPAIRLVVYTTLPFAVGIVLAYVLNPVVTFFQVRLKLSRLSGVVFVYLVMIGLVAAFFAMLLPNLIVQVRDAYLGVSEFIKLQLERSPEVAQLQAFVVLWLQEHGIDLREILFQNEGVRRAAGTAASSGLKAVGGVLQFAADVAAALVGGLLALTFVFLVNIYILLDFSRLRGVLEVLVPEKHRPRTFDVLAKMDVAVGGFIRGTLISASLVGVIQAVGIWGLGTFYISGLEKYALLIGVVAAVGTLVPYLGPIAGGTPAVLFVLFADSIPSMKVRVISLGLVFLMLAIVQAIEGFVLQPRVVGQSAQLHPVAVLFALALGANFGILGMILAVPAACIARVLVKEFFWDERVAEWRARPKRKAAAERAATA